MSAHHDVWQKLYREFMEVRKADTWKGDMPERVNAICSAVSQWVKTGNAHFMDQALELTHRYDAPHTPEFRAQLYRALCARREKTSSGTLKQVKRHALTDHAYLLICNFRFHGLSVADASAKAAAWLNKARNGEFCYSAGSFERMYQSEFVNTGMHDLLFIEWKDLGIEQGRQQWLEIAASIKPKAAMKGERR